jgi:hypothetical protein
MNNQKLTAAIVIIVALAAVAIAPSLINLASAKQSSTCTNNGGHSSTGPCTGNTEHNHKTCSAKNKGQTNKLC